MTAVVNDKAHAWNLVGGMFWEIGRKSARPSAAEIERFLEGVRPGQRVAVVGASTRELVEAAIERGAEVTVFDFSSRMCEDLAKALDGRPCTIRQLDITAPTPPGQAGRFELVMSDRLINRFTRDEGVRALTGMLGLLAPGGAVLTALKLGFYPMDLRMIEEGRRRGRLAEFYDEATRTIDFAAAGDILDACVLPHGDIPVEVLLPWYRGRGREARFDRADMHAMAASVRLEGRGLSVVEERPLPDAPETVLVRLLAG